MIITSLSTIPNYTFDLNSMSKIYSSKTLVSSKFIKFADNHTPLLTQSGEITLTKKCDSSLKHQAKSRSDNAVLGVNYSVYFTTDNNNNVRASMYAYGEAVHLM